MSAPRVAGQRRNRNPEATPRPTTADCRRAALVVCAVAPDAAAAREVLDMLGLLQPAEGDRPARLRRVPTPRRRQRPRPPRPHIVGGMRQ